MKTSELSGAWKCYKSQQWNSEFCRQRVPDNCTGDGEVSGAEYCSWSLGDKVLGISRSQVPSAGHRWDQHAVAGQTHWHLPDHRHAGRRATSGVRSELEWCDWTSWLPSLHVRPHAGWQQLLVPTTRLQLLKATLFVWCLKGINYRKKQLTDDRRPTFEDNKHMPETTLVGFHATLLSSFSDRVRPPPTHRRFCGQSLLRRQCHHQSPSCSAVQYTLLASIISNLFTA